MSKHLVVFTLLLCLSGAVHAQEPGALTEREKLLLQRVEVLEKRVADLEHFAKPPAAPAEANAPTPAVPAPSVLAGTTVNFAIDGYYQYNGNNPLGRVNLLRSFDPTANNFSLSQADIVVEHAPDVAAGRRLGMRLDLMFGQATETLQGGAQNEPRPQVYRNIFQAYGTYVAPLGAGLALDFGKFASSIGVEGVYTKDQINYSRSLLYTFLPAYHEGFRISYPLGSKLQAQYYLVNGVNQTEGFNGFKTNAFSLTLTPKKTVSWNIDYLFGQQGRDLVSDYNPSVPALPTQPGLSTIKNGPSPNGREHIFDTYASWSATGKLTLTGEADYAVNRSYSSSAPAHIWGGAAYAKYQWTPKFSFADRFEYFSDRDGLFSGTTQSLKEDTATATYQPANGFQVRLEFRRDWSDHNFFLTHTPGQLARDQTTGLLGFIWWFGGKEGSW